MVDHRTKLDKSGVKKGGSDKWGGGRDSLMGVKNRYGRSCKMNKY